MLFLGGGGQRKLVVIPPDSDGYNGQQLKGVSGSGKCTLYIAPLQEQIDTTPLPPEAKEFESMPKALCTTCGKMIPLQVLPLHIKNCKEENLCSSSEVIYLVFFHLFYILSVNVKIKGHWGFVFTLGK